MRIISLDVENIKRIAAAYITADDAAVVTIGGKNGHGKSSVLDAIAMAIGGKKLCPPEPLRRGEHHGHVTVDLGSFVITRRFWRSNADAIESSLQVTSPEGAEYRSPQALLDKLVSDLTFDPLAFLDLSPKDQREYVRKFVGLDFKALDGLRAAALEAARECETLLKVAEHDVRAGEYYPDAPAELTDVAGLLAEMEGAEARERAAVDAERAVDAKRAAYQLTLQAIADNDRVIADMVRQLDDRRTLSVQLDTARTRQEQDGQALRVAATQARAAVPDTAGLRTRVEAANTINARVQANRRHAALLTARDEARDELRAVRARIADIDAEKQRQLAAATFPVPGLSFSDVGLLFDGLPFEQASYAQQLRVAVAMGLASQPTLKVLLIKHGNALDTDSLRLLTALADEHEAQVWLERVAESAAGVSVLIEDGRITAVDGGPPPVKQVRVCVECGVEWAGTQRMCSCDAPAALVAG